MIVAGFGFRAAASAESLDSALRLAAGEAQVTALATAEDKAVASVFRDFAAARYLPVIPVPLTALQAAETITRSPRVTAVRGTGSVAEAAALAAAGPGARLIAARAVSADRMATCALAQGQDQ